VNSGIALSDSSNGGTGFAANAPVSEEAIFARVEEWKDPRSVNFISEPPDWKGQILVSLLVFVTLDFQCLASLDSYFIYGSPAAHPTLGLMLHPNPRIVCSDIVCSVSRFLGNSCINVHI
jgi:hypothetical protein